MLQFPVHYRCEPLAVTGLPVRISSATNVGEGKDSEARQRKAIEGYAKAAGYVIVDWFYEPTARVMRGCP